MNVKKQLSKNYINFRGWSTKRKIVVIESDDWGSTRMESEKAINIISKKYPTFLNSKFAQCDGLERKQDLEYLFETLSNYKDAMGNHPVVTALALTSNPDFEAIKNSNFSYKSESIVETYKKYNENGLFNLWINDGVKNNLLYPQFHGKEHLHPERYIKAISDNKNMEQLAFLNHSIVGGTTEHSRKNSFLAAFEYHNDLDKKNIEKRTIEGLKEFAQLFGFQSKSFCPSQSIYGNHIFEVLKENGVEAIQAGQQFEPNNYKLKKINHNWGDTTKNGLIFWRRNCSFEIFQTNTDHVNSCLKEIEIAFRWGKPAVINSHRINFTSRIKPDLRDRTLKEIKNLMKAILKKWPNVEFMNSSDLNTLISKSNNF